MRGKSNKLKGARMNTKKICFPRIIGSMSRKVSFLTLLAFSLLLSPMVAYGATVDLAWDANTESDLAGYKIYYGTASGNYSHSIDVGNVTQYTLTGLDDGITYYLAATAYDVDDNESAYSEELVHTTINSNHIITASAGANGSISPSGSVTVSHGSNRTFTISAGANYHVQDVVVDGTSVGAVSSYTLTNVTQNHTIQASFAINTHTITATAGANGNISPTGNVTVNHGSSRTFTISAGANYHVQNVLVDGVSVGAVSSYTFANVTQNHTIQASFAINTHTITATAGANGSISPTGNVTVNHGSSRTFTISAGANYHVQNVLVDGVSVGAVSSYTFANVTQNHTIQASFAINTHTITATAGANGSISPTGNVTVNHGSNRTFTISASANYHVQDVRVDGVSVGAVSSYTFTNVTQNHTVHVIFAGDEHPPAADAGTDQAAYISDTVHLDGSSSSDADGDELTFKWSFTSKPSGSSAALSSATIVNPTFVVDVAGTYIVQLIVNDGTTDSQPDTVIISTENSPPAADAGADQAVHVSDTVHLDGSSSSDADGDELTFKWSFTSKPGGSSAALSSATIVNPTFVVDVAGTYIMQLSVNDGSTDSQPDTVIISTENSPPAADAGADQAVYVSDTVHLDGSSSSDADGDELTFKWSFTSKPSGSSAALSSVTKVNPTFVVDVVGSYIVQLIVNDGTVNSQPDTVIISTENSPPAADAGDDQTVEEGDMVALNGLNSTDPNDNIISYSWKQTGGVKVNLTNPNEAEANFIAPSVGTEPEMLILQLTVIDAEGLQDIDTCAVQVTKAVSKDSDGDGVPDDQDAFPYDAEEYLDTDGDGEGNNSDTDDDNDGMPDTWELLYGLDPLIDDAAADPDGDGISNIDEYNLGTEPNYNEKNFAPDPPQLMNPGDSEIVGLTPLLETDEFYDPNIDDVHSRTQWKIIRAEDEFIVFDVTTSSSLTALKVPKLILEDDTDYIWKVKFIDNQGAASEWSETGYFTTEFFEQDSDGNGVLDHQEVDTTIDLDQDGIMDRDQEDIKCVATETGDFKIGISIREDENVESILSIQSEAPDDPDLLLSAQDGPKFLAFGLIHFKLLVKEPGDEVLVTIYLSKAAFNDGIWYKYDPVNAEWVDYSEFIDFSADRKMVYLTLTDGGFGDADGIENGVIVDPLALRTATDHSSSGSDFFVNDVVDSLNPSGMCFISAADPRSADRQPWSLWREIRSLELSIVFILMMLAYIGKEISLRIKRYRRIGRRTSLMEGWKDA